VTEQSEERKTLGWNYGGQALIEGVLMRGPHVAAVAVRHPDGTIDVKTQNLGKLYTGPLSKIPFIRGLPMLWDSLGLGMKALFYSAEVAGQEEDPNFSLQGAAGIGMGAFSMLLGVGLFMLLPSLIAGLLVTGERALLFNLVEGAIRLALLVGYMAAVGQMPEIRRVFAYHGAEHKTINAHEAGAPLTVEGIRPFTTAHPRCGTAFLLMVVLISILVFAPLGKPALLIRLASRLLLVPVISGIAYELLRFTGKHADNPLVRTLIAPNLALQRLTTREPDDSMLEVALTSLKAVLAGEAAAQG
jgi:uncharacterized protein YqhQ